MPLIVTAQLDKLRAAFYPVRNLVERVECPTSREVSRKPCSSLSCSAVFKTSIAAPWLLMSVCYRVHKIYMQSEIAYTT